jgi:hypothetical protein
MRFAKRFVSGLGFSRADRPLFFVITRGFSPEGSAFLFSQLASSVHELEVADKLASGTVSYQGTAQPCHTMLKIGWGFSPLLQLE